MILGGGEPQQQTKTVEPEHDHQEHFSILHDPTFQTLGLIMVALIGLAGIWLKTRHKRSKTRHSS